MIAFFGADQRLEGALDQVLARLHEHLEPHVVGDAVFLDEPAVEGELGLRGRREADLDLLEAASSRAVEQLELLARRSSAWRAPGCRRAGPRCTRRARGRWSGPATGGPAGRSSGTDDTWPFSHSSSLVSRRVPCGPRVPRGARPKKARRRGNRRRAMHARICGDRQCVCGLRPTDSPGIPGLRRVRRRSRARTVFAFTRSLRPGGVASLPDCLQVV